MYILANNILAYLLSGYYLFNPVCHTGNKYDITHPPYVYPATYIVPDTMVARITRIVKDGNGYTVYFTLSKDGEDTDSDTFTIIENAGAYIIHAPMKRRVWDRCYL